MRLTKVYCGRYSCRFGVGEICTRDVISVKDDGKCDSYRGALDSRDNDTWSIDPWDNYDKQSQSEDLMEQQRKRMRLLREDKISKNDVN